MGFTGVPSKWREATQEDVSDDTSSPDIHLQTITVERERVATKKVSYGLTEYTQFPSSIIPVLQSGHKKRNTVQCN